MKNGILFIVFIIAVIVILLTDKTSPFYKSSLANGVILSNLSPNNQLYQQYRTEDDAKKIASLLMSLYSAPEKKGDLIQIYRNNDGRVILVDHKNQLASTANFFFDAIALNNDSYTYHPAETVYTGVTTGGIHVGGTHTKPAYYTQSQYFSGNAIIFLNYSKNLPYFLVSCIQLSKEFTVKAQDVPELNGLMNKDGVLTLFGEVSEDAKFGYASALSSGNVYTGMAAQSMLTSSAGLPMEKCKIIAKWLTNVIK